MEDVKAENRTDVKYTVNMRAIHDCMLAMSKEEARYYLCGVSIKDVDGMRHYCGTDGHILVHFEEELNGEPLNQEIILKPFGKLKVDKNDGERYDIFSINKYDFIRFRQYDCVSRIDVKDIFERVNYD